MFSPSYLSNFPFHCYRTGRCICLPFQRAHTEIHPGMDCLHKVSSALDIFHLQKKTDGHKRTL